MPNQRSLAQIGWRVVGSLDKPRSALTTDPRYTKQVSGSTPLNHPLFRISLLFSSSACCCPKGVQTEICLTKRGDGKRLILRSISFGASRGSGHMSEELFASVGVTRTLKARTQRRNGERKAEGRTVFWEEGEHVTWCPIKVLPPPRIRINVPSFHKYCASEQEKR